MAESLINRGASVVVGWDNAVGSMDNDRALLIFFENNFVNNYEIDKNIDLNLKSFLPEYCLLRPQ